MPHFVSMERKPEDGCEIWSACDGSSSVMISLKLVKGHAEQDDSRSEAEKFNFGTAVLLKLIEPWNHSSRFVCADSYFSSAQTALACKERRIKYIGAVKTATREYPMAYLGQYVLGAKGSRHGLLAKDENGHPEFLAFVWADRDRWYFNASGSSMAEGTPQCRQRWRQIIQDDFSPPEKVDIIVPQPKAAEVYYSTCGKIDQHNRARQAALSLERKFTTHDWSSRVNFTILSMCIVDTLKLWNLMTTNYDDKQDECQKDFYGYLALELIDNTYDDMIRGRTRNATILSPCC
jgi:Transposase IS4